MQSSYFVFACIVAIFIMSAGAWGYSSFKARELTPAQKRRQYLDRAYSDLVDNQLWLEHYTFEVEKNRARIERLEAEVRHDPDIAPSTVWGWAARNTEAA